MNPESKTEAQAARDFAIELARLAADAHCREVVVLDVRGVSPVTDYFVLATGASTRQMGAVIDHAVELGRSIGFSPMNLSGHKGETWLLADFVHVVLHVFAESARLFYDLDNMWGDAPKVMWEREDR